MFGARLVARDGLIVYIMKEKPDYQATMAGGVGGFCGGAAHRAGVCVALRVKSLYAAIAVRLLVPKVWFSGSYL
ncbi:MAG: hypothetical protein AAGH88_09155 [Planctomycetota bacterium]